MNFLWALSAVLVLLGLAGTVLPVRPGTLLVWAGLLLGAWIDDFTRVSVVTSSVGSMLYGMRFTTLFLFVLSAIGISFAERLTRDKI